MISKAFSVLLKSPQVIWEPPLNTWFGFDENEGFFASWYISFSINEGESKGGVSRKNIRFFDTYRLKVDVQWVEVRILSRFWTLNISFLKWEHIRVVSRERTSKWLLLFLTYCQTDRIISTSKLIYQLLAYLSNRLPDNHFARLNNRGYRRQ